MIRLCQTCLIGAVIRFFHRAFCLYSDAIGSNNAKGIASLHTHPRIEKPVVVALATAVPELFTDSLPGVKVETGDGHLTWAGIGGKFAEVRDWWPSRSRWVAGRVVRRVACLPTLLRLKKGVLVAIATAIHELFTDSFAGVKEEIGDGHPTWVGVGGKFAEVRNWGTKEEKCWSISKCCGFFVVSMWAYFP